MRHFTIETRKAKVAEFKSVSYGKKMTWLRKQKFSASALYRWLQMYGKQKPKKKGD